MVANDVARANSLKNLPTIDDILAIGKNTTRLVSVAAITATATSVVPDNAASFELLPIFRCRKIFAKTTTELATRTPTATVKPIKVIIFNVIPNIFSKKKVDIIEAGIVTLLVLLKADRYSWQLN